jgi:hypothetical protein
MIEAMRGDLRTGEVLRLGKSAYGCVVDALSSDHRSAVLVDEYTFGDNVLYLWREGQGERRLLYGKPLEARAAGEEVVLNSIHESCFTNGDRSLLFLTTLFEDTTGLATMAIDRPEEIRPVEIRGLKHRGVGELEHLDSLGKGRYLLGFNIDGEDWLYAGSFDESTRQMNLDTVVCGLGEVSGGVIAGHKHHHEEASGGFAFGFSTSTSPTQIVTVDPSRAPGVVRHTRERVFGIPDGQLSWGKMPRSSPTTACGPRPGSTAPPRN